MSNKKELIQRRSGIDAISEDQEALGPQGLRLPVISDFLQRF